jgi:hypothetical protein
MNNSRPSDFESHKSLQILNELSGNDSLTQRELSGRLGIAYQRSDDSLPRGQVISEIILNWLPSVLKDPESRQYAVFSPLLDCTSVHDYHISLVRFLSPHVALRFETR